MSLFMAHEIERKFLVTGETWRTGTAGVPYVQGYLSQDPDRVVRVRRAGDRAFLTIKGRTRGITRPEFEYPIPLADAEELLKLCQGSLVEKTRFTVPWAGKHWEVDVFHGANTGLVVAELELASEEEPFERPPWLGAEVSQDPRYANVRLAACPFSRWDRPAGA